MIGRLGDSIDSIGLDPEIQKKVLAETKTGEQLEGVSLKAGEFFEIAKEKIKKVLAIGIVSNNSKDEKSLMDGNQNSEENVALEDENLGEN